MLFNLNMSLWYNYLICIVLIAVGVNLLIKCSDMFVDGASYFAKKLKISPLVIGLTVVAFGTSMPELAISASDSIACLINGGNANIAIGNVVGSNICNILLVLGCSVIICPIVLKKNVIKVEYPIMFGMSLLATMFILLFSLNGTYAILRWEGIILIIGIIAYVTYLVLKSRKETKLLGQEQENDSIKNIGTWKAIIFLVIGLSGIVLGGELVVNGAKSIAVGIGDLAGLNHDLVESLVGLTIVAVGTSLPELVTSVVAAKKGENEIAIGNVVGSNIFNLLFILGVSSTINPLTIGSQIIIDLAVMLLVVIIAFILSLKGKLNRKDGIIFVLCYVTYVSYLVLRTVL